MKILTIRLKHWPKYQKFQVSRELVALLHNINKI